MSKKRGTELQRTKERNEKLVQMVQELRAKDEAYQQLGGIYAAYIGVLLEMMGATADKPVLIDREDINAALDKQEVKIKAAEDGTYSMWVE